MRRYATSRLCEISRTGGIRTTFALVAERIRSNPGIAANAEEAVTVLQKDIKRRKESIELFRQGKREDLVEKEEADLAVIAAYVPKELSREELEKIVGDVIAAGAKDFNSAMRETMKVVKGRADGKAVGEAIKAKLSA